MKSTLLRAGGAAGVPARALVCGDQLCADAAHRIQRLPNPAHRQGKDRRKWDTYRLSVKGIMSRDEYIFKPISTDDLSVMKLTAFAHLDNLVILLCCLNFYKTFKKMGKILPGGLYFYPLGPYEKYVPYQLKIKYVLYMRAHVKKISLSHFFKRYRN